MHQSAAFGRVPRVARSAPRQQPAPVGAGTLRPLPAAGAGPSLAPPPEIRRAQVRQQRARVVLALAPPAGALSARLPLASLDRALRARKGGGVAASPQLARALRARAFPASAAHSRTPAPPPPLHHRCAPPLRAAGYGPPMASLCSRLAPSLAARLWRAALPRCLSLATCQTAAPLRYTVATHPP